MGPTCDHEEVTYKCEEEDIKQEREWVEPEVSASVSCVGK